MPPKDALHLDFEGPAPVCSPSHELLDSRRRRSGGLASGGASPAVPFSLIGRLVGHSNSGVPLVDFAENPEPEPMPARHTCNISRGDAGREAVLVFEGHDLRKPIILGLLQSCTAREGNVAESGRVSVTVDGERVALSAQNEIVLTCGKASITLTRGGKVLIRGEYVVSRSSGLNRIKGGTVQIN